MVGAFPPPLHGMAAVNAAMHERLLSKGADPLVINLAAPSLDRRLSVRLLRLPRIFQGLINLSCTRGLRNGVLYMSVSGGMGQIYELAFLLLARLRSMRIFLHHHTFAYIDIRSRVTASLVRTAGAKATHIVLSSGMAARFEQTYSHARLIVPISNVVFLLVTTALRVQTRQRLQVIGFLSNISPGKGVFEFLDLCAAIQSKGLSIHARLAGPFQDATIERQVRQKLVELPGVDYVGPRYGIEKDAFYLGIDALVLPTRLNEAEPLIIHEAMSCGIPVIAYGRGCIPEIVSPKCGLVVPPEDAFVPAALAQIEAWIAVPQAFQAASAAAAARFATLLAESLRRWEDIQADLLDVQLHKAKSK